MDKNISCGIFLTFTGIISTPSYAETSNNDATYDINSKTSSQIVNSRPSVAEILAAARARANMSANANNKWQYESSSLSQLPF